MNSFSRPYLSINDNEEQGYKDYRDRPENIQEVCSIVGKIVPERRRGGFAPDIINGIPEARELAESIGRTRASQLQGSHLRQDCR